MSDLISRQAAIDAVCESCSIEGDYHKCNGYPKDSTWCEEITALRNTPSADVVPVKRGKWIRLEYDTFTCNLCGTTFMLMQGMSKMHYCPNCGAKMDGENE